MTRLLVICEGPTEESFVKNCLAPHLLGHSVYAFPQLISRRPGTRGGGDVSLTSLTAHIRRVHRNFDCVTTLVDYYGFAGKGEMDKDQLVEAISSRAAKQIGGGFDPQRVIPYVQMHEFEALLFSKPDCFDVEEEWTDSQRREVASIRAGFLSPEDINDHPNTAPSKLLLDVFTKPAFSKTLHGPLIAERIGLDVMREACPGFGAWLSRLESLAAGS
jgi:hypothetical protein